MRAVVRKQFGGPEQLALVEIAKPEPQSGHVLIEVKAFGINHAETHMRKGEWAEAAPVSGIECVGVVAACPGGEFAIGRKVIALMGGLGRSLNGSYAEFTNAPAANVVQVDTDMPWQDLAAIPESYATAWTCLHRNLELAAGQRLVIRGATSALGLAAVNVAAGVGAEIVATTRNPERAAKLRALGARGVELEQANLSGRVRTCDAVLDLVGNSTMLDSLAIVRRGGRVCLAGFLGGLAPLDSFNPLLQMPSGVQFNFFGSFMFGAPEFPLSDVPMQAIVDEVAAGRYQAKPARVFPFEEVAEAHRVMEANRAFGKLVVRICG